MVSSSSPHKEKFAVKEAYRVLRDHYQKFFNKEVDLESEIDLQEEGQGRRRDKKKRNELSQQVELKAKGVIFIKVNEAFFTEPITMEKFITPIFQQIHSQGKFLSKDIS